MKRVHCMAGALLASMWTASASAAIDDNAAEVFLRTSCTENGNTIDNCFTSMTTLNTWIWNTRKPGTTSGRKPLLVSVGPGKHLGQFHCDASVDDDPVAPGLQRRGHVTLRGSGANNSTLEHDNAIFTIGCENLTFESITIRNTSPASGVTNLGGTTVWNNVELHGRGYVWNDGVGDMGCEGRSPPPGKHIWNNSRIIGSVGELSGTPFTIGYYNHCDDGLFLGSELSVQASGAPGLTVQRHIAIFTRGAVLRFYGGAIRVLSDTGVTTNGIYGGEIAVLLEGESPEVHVHGTGIDMISKAGNNQHAINMEFTGGMVHMNGAAYMMKTSGTRKRIIHNQIEGYPSMVMAPYLWEPLPTPPNIHSKTGQDTVVVTATSDNKPHTLVYDENCGARWFDNNTNACYQ